MMEIKSTASTKSLYSTSSAGVSVPSLAVQFRDSSLSFGVRVQSEDRTCHFRGEDIRKRIK